MAFSKNRRLADIIADTSGNVNVPTQSASDNDTSAASTAYVTTAVSGLIDSAPGTLNTLNEIAAALNDDANFNTTVTNAIASKLPLAGGTLTGDIRVGTADAANRLITVSGGATGNDEGGEIRLDMAADHDGSYEFWRIDVNQDDLRFGRTGLTDVLIDSSGNVGIGTSSPSDNLHVVGDIRINSNTPQLKFTSADNSSNSYSISANINDSTDGGFFIQEGLTNGTNVRFAINATGKVGIGTTNPEGTCHIHSGSAGTITAAASGNNLVAENSGAVGMSLLFDDAANNAYGNIYWGNETDGSADGRITYFGSTYVTAGDRQSMVFRTANTERLRIDSSGNLLVGKTSIDGGSTAGVELRGGIGFAAISRSGDVVANFSRLTNDGNIVAFRKDSSDIGHIGTEGTDLTIGSGGAGFQFLESENKIRPFNMSTNSASNGVVDLGRANANFKDLYLSGAIKMDSDLDDYEEGSWTPTASTSNGNGSFSVTVNYAKYIKVGGLVHASCYLSIVVSNVGSGAAIIGGLPFVNTSGQGYSIASVGHASAIEYHTNDGVAAYVTNGHNYIRHVNVTDTGNVGWSGTGTKYYMMSCTYHSV